MNIVKAIEQFPTINKFCVECSSSVENSAVTRQLIFGEGWSGLWIGFTECYNRFPFLYVVSEKVTLHNITNILKEYNVLKRPGCLVLNSSEYDYHVLEALLKMIRPSMIIVSINIKIQPPIRVTSTKNGMSLSKLFDLCVGFYYSLVNIENNYAFLLDKQISGNKFYDFAADELYKQRFGNSYDSIEQYFDLIKKQLDEKNDHYQIHI